MTLDLIAAGRHHGDPHRVLGRHDGVVRAYRPEAVAMRLVAGPRPAGKTTEMTRVHPAGVFEAPIGKGVKRYRLEADYDAGRCRRHLPLRRSLSVLADAR